MNCRICLNKINKDLGYSEYNVEICKDCYSKYQTDIEQFFNNKKEQCISCKYFAGLSCTGDGVCFRNPPTVVYSKSASLSGGVVTECPDVRYNYWCGEWKERKIKDEVNEM